MDDWNEYEYEMKIIKCIILYYYERGKTGENYKEKEYTRFFIRNIWDRDRPTCFLTVS